MLLQERMNEVSFSRIWEVLNAEQMQLLRNLIPLIEDVFFEFKRGFRLLSEISFITH